MRSDETFFERLAEATLRKCSEQVLANAVSNSPYVQKTVRDLVCELEQMPGRPALVVSGGPSLHKNRHIEVLKDEGFEGYLVAADGSMGHLLRNGKVPDFVLTVDPHAHRIIRWFGDKRMTERPEDDYFKRQDIDPEHNEDESRRNKETIELVDRYGSQIKLVISASVTPEITQRALEAGMHLYWWNPLFDDPNREDSLTRKIRELVDAPCLTTGGNVGSSCWVFAQVILQSDPVLMVGMDFSYPPGTSVLKTQYYHELKELFPEDPSMGLFEVYNPHLNETWLTDPAYYWYQKNFLQMVSAAQGKTVNCTEGGILFGDSIYWKPLRQTLKELKKE